MFMQMKEAIERADEALSVMLRLARNGEASCEALRLGLQATKALKGKLDAFQADSAVQLAAREHRGDSGAGVLATATGLSRRDAAVQVKAAQQISELPEVQQAVEEGRVSMTNARAIARACDKAGTKAVGGDDGLLQRAAGLSVEQFAREANRWAAARSSDDGESLYRRQRARRSLSVFDGEDGMVLIRGELDPVCGARIRKRLLAEAERLRRCDIRTHGSEQRNLVKRLADSLDTLTASCGSEARAGIEGVSSAGGGTVSGAGGGVAGVSSTAGSAAGGTAGRNADGVAGVSSTAGGTSGGTVSGAAGSRRRVSTDITIVQHLTAEGDRAFAEIAGGDTIPQSVLEEHMCNAHYRGAVFSSKGVPLWQGHRKSAVTDAQKAALVASYGRCGGCGAHHGLCDAHHIVPLSRGGPTDIDNLILLCWECHHKVHHHGWRVVPRGDLRTIAPPQRLRYGPAHAPDASDRGTLFPEPAGHDPPLAQAHRS